MRKPAVLAALLTTALAFVSGCGGASCPTPRPTDPSALLRKHREARPRANTLRAEARVDQRGDQGRIKGKVMMFLERPNRVRFDAVTQFGPVLILTSDGEEFALSDFKENTFLTGPACERNIARMIGVALSGPDVVSVLFGDAPASDATQGPVGCSDGAYAVKVQRADGLSQELFLSVLDADRDKPPAEQRTRLVRAVLRDARGHAVFRVEYDDYRRVNETLELPFSVHVFDERRDADTLLRFQDIDVDVTIPEGAFAQTPRKGLSVQTVSCD